MKGWAQYLMNGPAITINDAQIIEGNVGLTNATFTVSLSAASPQDIFVYYEMADGTAAAFIDYLPGSLGYLRIPAGKNSALITIGVIGDQEIEPDETFFVNLYNPHSATIADGQGIGTIINDDPSPTAANALISGRITMPNGAPIAGAVINLSGSQSRNTITDANGNYRFDGVETSGFYTVTPSRVNFGFAPMARSFSQLGNHTEATFTAVPTAELANPLDTAEYFVRQQYVDFLGREPEQGGFDYWTNEITSCGADQLCIRTRRIAVSDAFFFEPEFQETAGYIYRIYRASLNQRPSYAQFMPDRARVVGGAQLDRSKTDFTSSFVQRPAFSAQYPDTMSAARYVEALNANTGNSLRPAQVEALTTGLTNSSETRGSVLRKVADNSLFIDHQYNSSFVLMEYFGYLRRDPDQEGFDFWLGQVNRFSLRNVDVQHSMVCSFITSAEYQQRFSSVVAHTNAECPQ